MTMTLRARGWRAEGGPALSGSEGEPSGEQPTRPRGRRVAPTRDSSRDVSSRRRSIKRVGVAGASTLFAALAAVIVSDFYATVKERLSSNVPLTVVVEEFVDCPSGQYVLPAGDVDEDVLPPPDGVDSSWVRERGGGDASGAVYSVTLQGKSEVAVTLTGLDVVGVRPLDPPEDVVVLTRCHGGGDLYPRRFSIDLDAPQPRVEALAGDRDEPGDGAEDPMSFPYFVSSTTPEVFWIGASSTKCFCEWALELRWSAEGKTGVVPLKLDDRMFVTAPVRGDEPRYLYWEDGTLDRLQ